MGRGFHVFRVELVQLVDMFEGCLRTADPSGFAHLR